MMLRATPWKNSGANGCSLTVDFTEKGTKLRVYDVMVRKKAVYRE